MRAIKIILAGLCALLVVDVGAAPITVTQSGSFSDSLFGNSAGVNRYSNFTGQDDRSLTFAFDKFDSSLGTLLGVELTLSSVVSHPSRSVFLENVSGVPVDFQFGAFAQDTERELNGFLNLYAFYDARVSYRADYRFTLDPRAPGLFAPLAAEAAFGSCAHTENLFGDIGDTNPYCFAGNNGSPLGAFNYNWGPFSGSDLAQFIGNDALLFDARMNGDMYGYCDDNDVGDYCRVNLSTRWDGRLTVAYTYEPGVPGTGGGTGGGGTGGSGGDPMAVPEPGTAALLGIGLAGLLAARRRQGLKARWFLHEMT